MLQCPRCGRQFSDDALTCPDDLTPLQADTTIADVPVDPLIGRIFDEKYRLDERLGGGGMGTVYRATHLLIERTVAIKVLSQRFLGDETAQQRFHREARAAGRMQHPNAVTVTDFGATTDGYLYIVMELLEGHTLRELLAKEGPFDPARAVSIMLQTCAAVGAAHDAGLIHRDLKPANIFIEQRPDTPATVKVLDFGVAKFVVEEHEDDDYQTLTQVGAIIGTPRYMSPEQCSGVGQLTPASDVYSLGIIFYEMLTGSPPFNADTPLALALKHVAEQARPLREVVSSLPDKLDSLIARALAKNPSDRFADANELRRELYATARELGLEHSGRDSLPAIEALRSAGNESPSGRLIVDLATMREVQAATSKEKPESSANSVAAHPEFARVNVPLEKKQEGAESRRQRIALLSMIAVIVIIALAAVASRWWNPAQPVALVTNPLATSSPSPGPSPSSESSPSPSPSASPSRKKPVRRVGKRESAFGSFMHKVRRIFKR